MFAVKAETHDGEILCLRKGFKSSAQAEQHPVTMKHWKRIWVEQMPDVPERQPGLPPFPWNWEATDKPTSSGCFHIYLIDAAGKKIAAIWGANHDKALTADFIVESCNRNAPSPRQGEE